MITGVITRDPSYPPVGILARDGVHPCFLSNPRAGAGHGEKFAYSPDLQKRSFCHTVPGAYTEYSNRENEGVSSCKVLHAWFDPRPSAFSGIFTPDALNGNSLYFSILGETEKFAYKSGLAICLRQSSAHVNGRHSNGYAQNGALVSSSTKSMQQRWCLDRSPFRSWRAVPTGGRRGFAILESYGSRSTGGMGIAVVTTESV